MRRLKVSDNHRFLVYEDGAPFFYLGDTAWELAYRLNREEIRFYLEDRAAKGFTVIMMMTLPEMGELRRPNPEGELPLIDRDPAKPNERFFDYIGYILDQCESLGLYLGLVPAWGDHVGPQLVGKNPQILNEGNAAGYGEYLGRRFRDRALIWILGGDRPVETEQQAATWRALAAGLREGDGGRRLMSFHPHRWYNSSLYFHEDDWLDFNMIQSGHGSTDIQTYGYVESDYGKLPPKPTMETEYCYENHPENWKKDGRRFDDYDTRKGAYWSVFAGGHGFTYGCNDIFSFYKGPEDLALFGCFHPNLPWREALNLPGACQMRHLRALMESRPFLTRIPDQNLLISDPGTGSAHVRATRDEQGRYAFVYVADGRPVTVDLDRLTGQTLNAYWFDPRRGTAEKIDVIAREGARTFTPPSAGYGQDWVLALDDTARGWRAPGAGPDEAS